MLKKSTLVVANFANIANIANMSEKTSPEPKRCMTTLTPEMLAVLPEIERATNLNISDVLRQGFVKVWREVKATGQLTLLPMPEAE